MGLGTTLILFHAVQVYRGQLGGIFCLQPAPRSVLKTEKKQRKKKKKPLLCLQRIWIKLMSIETGNFCIFFDERCLFLTKKKLEEATTAATVPQTECWSLDGEQASMMAKLVTESGECN